MGVLRERDEVRTGFESSARRLQHLLRRFHWAALERLGPSSRPRIWMAKIGMDPAARSDGLASA
jgi:hypothetical protein